MPIFSFAIGGFSERITAWGAENDSREFRLRYTCIQIKSFQSRSSFSPSPTFAACGSVLNNLQYTYALSRISGLSHSPVAVCSTRCTMSCVCPGFLRNNLTVAVMSCSWTWAFSSLKFSRKDSISSSALSIRSAYSPIIQISEPLASGSSRASRFSQREGITPS